jgi:hypothetical protein
MQSGGGDTTFLTGMHTIESVRNGSGQTWVDVVQQGVSSPQGLSATSTSKLPKCAAKRNNLETTPTSNPPKLSGDYDQLVVDSKPDAIVDPQQAIFHDTEKVRKNFENLMTQLILLDKNIIECIHKRDSMLSQMSDDTLIEYVKESVKPSADMLVKMLNTMALRLECVVTPMSHADITIGTTKHQNLEEIRKNNHVSVLRLFLTMWYLIYHLFKSPSRR